MKDKREKTGEKAPNSNSDDLGLGSKELSSRKSFFIQMVSFREIHFMIVNASG
jgi:hypothetical protein